MHGGFGAMAGAMGGGYGQRSTGHGEQPMSGGQGGTAATSVRASEARDPSDVSQRGARMRESSTHRGRGPRDYKRSDERIREDVCDRLTEDHDIDASEITVKVEGGEVTLEGTVEDRRLKWMAGGAGQQLLGRPRGPQPAPPEAGQGAADELARRDDRPVGHLRRERRQGRAEPDRDHAP